MNKRHSITQWCFIMVCWLGLSFMSWADPFTIKGIKIKGLKRIKPATVLSYLSDLEVVKGRVFSEQDSTKVIDRLYQTRFFSDIRLSNEADWLVVDLVERPTIAQLNIIGNKAISKEQLEKTLKQLGLQVGDLLDEIVLEQVRQMLSTQYMSQGNYNVTVETQIESRTDNRVAVTLLIDEGKRNRIKEISIMGNEAFSDNVLLKQLKAYISTPGLLTFFTDKDKYSKEKLQAALEELKDFYLNKGYAEFKIESQQVVLTPNTHDVSLTITVKEGPKYRIGGYSVAGYDRLTPELFETLVQFRTGDLFSKDKIIETLARVRDWLANKGFSFSNMDVQPVFNAEAKTVTLNFLIYPGRPVYVRFIDIKGNHKTDDLAIRRALRQGEGELLSEHKLRETNRQLYLLTYVDDVRIEKVPVPDTNNQVDLTIDVTEGQSAEINATLGVGTNGVEFSAGINQYNAFGSGNRTGLQFKRDAWTKQYSASYYNPYFTPSGIGQGFRFFFEQQRTGTKRLLSNVEVTQFTAKRFGGAVNYNIPINNYHSFQLGLGYDWFKITNLSSSPPVEVMNFVAHYGVLFREIQGTAGWTYSSYDRLPFPEKGIKQTLDAMISLPGGHHAIQYYKLDYAFYSFYPVAGGFIASASAHINFGHGFGGRGILPFYERYYAGGINREGQVRGFRSASLGPQDSHNRSIGGNLSVGATLALILPKPLSRDTVRTSLFLDTGNAYNTREDRRFDGANNGPLRWSAGISVEWRTPLGPLVFSLAKALNKKSGDEIEGFQFTMAHHF